MKSASLKGLRQFRFTVPAVFGVLVFLVELIPPPTSRFFQVLTALFITVAALTVHRLGGATYTCLIAGLLDAVYTGMPIVLVLFALRGGSFDFFLTIFKVWGSPSTVRVATSSVLSSLIAGFAAYFAVVEWLELMVVPFEIFMSFIVMSAILSGIGAVVGVRVWRRLP